jgi:hypothetical protein
VFERGRHEIDPAELLVAISHVVRAAFVQWHKLIAFQIREREEREAMDNAFDDLSGGGIRERRA